MALMPSPVFRVDTAVTPWPVLVGLELAERLRLHADRWFHDCGYETHREMAEHQGANRRSGLNYDDMVPGLSQYVHDATIAEGCSSD